MIQIENCTKKYGDLVAVNNLSLKVDDAEIFGFLGPNGAGKSTTIKMLVGLIKPDTGTLSVGGHDIMKDPTEAKKLIAYVPERGYIFEKLKAWEYLTFIAGLYGMDDQDFQEKGAQYLEHFGLSEWKGSVIGNFSHGMKQRLLLTAAFMRDPRVLILDEPHNGLDPRGIRLLKDTLFSARDNGTTIILCTHIIAIAEEICDRIAIINRGTIAATGTREDMRHYSTSTDRNLEDIFLRLTSDYEK